MRSLKTLGHLVTVGACLVAVVSLSSSAFARPKYCGAITECYPELAKKHGKDGKLTCAVCHPSTEKSKKARNNYGAALGKHLEKKNETDVDKIKAALKKTEDDKSKTEGKTFGDLIKAGDLPGTDEKADE